MGRELKRVALDFRWPLQVPWEGFCNPYYAATPCRDCNRTGYSLMARKLSNLGFQHKDIKAECSHREVSYRCDNCNGEGEVWPSSEARKAYDDWQKYEPPS